MPRHHYGVCLGVAKHHYAAVHHRIAEHQEIRVQELQLPDLPAAQRKLKGQRGNWHEVRCYLINYGKQAIGLEMRGRIGMVDVHWQQYEPEDDGDERLVGPYDLEEGVQVAPLGKGERSEEIQVGDE